MPKIKTLSAMPHPAVYRRKNNQLYLKLNEGFHVKVKRAEGNTGWIGAGKARVINPDEEVLVIDPGQNNSV